MQWVPLEKRNLVDSEIVAECKALATWPVRMNLPLPSGAWLDTGGGVDKLLRGDDNVRVIAKPNEPLGLKAYWHVNPLTDLFGSLRGKKILDVGCGVGYIGLLAAQRGAHVMATEMNDKNIERAKIVFNCFNVNERTMVIKSDMQAMTRHELGTFDAVLLCGTIYHCEHPQDVLMRISEMTDTLVVDSRLATADQVNDCIDELEFFTEEYNDSPEFDSIRRVGGGILRKPTRRSLFLMLERAGFNSIHQTMPYNGLAEQFRSENFIQFVAHKKKNIRAFHESYQ